MFPFKLLSEPQSAPHSSGCSSTMNPNSSQGSELPLILPPPFSSECNNNYQHLNISPCHAVCQNRFFCLLGLPGPHWRLVKGEGLPRRSSGSSFQHETSAEGAGRWWICIKPKLNFLQQRQRWQGLASVSRLLLIHCYIQIPKRGCFQLLPFPFLLAKIPLLFSEEFYFQQNSLEIYPVRP